MDPVVQIDPAHIQLTQTLRAAQSDKFKDDYMIVIGNGEKFKVSSMFLRFRGGDYWLKMLEGGFKEGENNLKKIVSGGQNDRFLFERHMQYIIHLRKV